MQRDRELDLWLTMVFKKDNHRNSKIHYFFSILERTRNDILSLRLGLVFKQGLYV